MKRIREVWEAGSWEDVRDLWDLSDGYGEPGYVPDQGLDWSGIRDSSTEAIEKMAQLLEVR